jgi:hypothetical protein
VFVSSVVWTGSNSDSTATALNCSGWTTTSGQFGTVGATTSAQFWGEIALDGFLGCGSSARLYCFQSPAVPAPRPAWPEPAALVFLKSGGLSGNLSGIGSADVACQDQAAAAGLPAADSFVAWLSDFSTDAKDRLTIDGPWHRVDGVRVAASKAALTDADIDSAINRFANGSGISTPQKVWTGTFGSGTKSANTCNSWFSSLVTEHGLPGSSDETGNSWTATADFSDLCNDAGRWYCFGNTIVIFWDRFESGDAARWSARVGYTP